MEQHTPERIYQQQIDNYRSALQQLLAKRRRLGWTRFFIFLATAFIAVKLFTAAGAWGAAVLIPGIALLLFFVSKDTDNNNEITHTKTLIALNEEELLLLRYHYSQRYDGAEWSPADHPHANDLDLLGKDSLYQYINRCYTEQGRKLLAANLLFSLPLNQVMERQEAAKELAPLYDWRQHLQARAMQTPLTLTTEQRVLQWMNDQDEHYTQGFWSVLVNLYSAISILSIVAVVAGYISVPGFTTLYLVYLSIASLMSRNAEKPYRLISGIATEISVIEQLLRWIESKTFRSTLLQRLHRAIGAGNGNATTQLHDFRNILNRFDFRLNWFGVLFFNAFLLWDTRQIISLNAWRKRNKEQVPAWSEVIAQFEVLHTLANLHFSQPEWCFPNFAQEHFTYSALAVGHPLIADAHRVNNDFDLAGQAKIGLITGSNMAGKSTFLRSLGVSIVMAQAGAPVCARKLLLSRVQLMSSMRIADNLAENTSTFYAELKKLKTIIEAVDRHEQVFILLDEILRGTNSLDRHKGSEALIAQFINKNAVAVIATHDVELARLEQRYPSSVENYHFDVQVAGGELYFDYKLKHGVCTSMNASILMKKIGIEMP